MEFKTIRQVHDAFDAKKLSPAELTEQYLSRIQKSDHNAYLLVLEERARAQAKKAQSILEKEGKVPRDQKPLLGIPLGIKDLLTMDGVRTTCGSRILENYIPPYTATCVQKLEDAGAVSLGKINMDEFAMGSSNENSAFGPVKHPTHPDHVPGGSSGGSGTAVGADLCFAALGTDTGGSIRLPASFCGIVGMKPTYGRVSRNGLIAFASSLDQVGPMTRSIEDAALLLEVMAGYDPMDSTSAPMIPQAWKKSLQEPFSMEGLKVGVPTEYFSHELSPDVQKHIDAALKWYESQGAKLVEVSLPHTQWAVATYYVVAVSEASSNLSRYDGIRFGNRPKAAEQGESLDEFYKKVRAQFGPEVKRRIILGAFALSSGYYDAYYKKACQVRRLIQQDFFSAFEKVDLIAAPVSPTTAFKVGEKSADPLSMYLMDIFTIPASLAGLPALSVPCGKDRDGLSVGLQLIGPQFEETRILQAANAFEKAHQ
jgi:aspartyl-tRNA(Asn)/glutamyl-tRNA(Gln) amidotransferase subunit A